MSLTASIVVVLIGALCSRAHAADGLPTIKQLLQQMTLEEKVGEMTQLSTGMFAPAGADAPGANADPEVLDMAKFEEAIVKYHVGSFFNMIRYAWTPGQWRHVIDAVDAITANKTRLHIPVLYGIDAMHGANYTVGAVLFPQAIGLGATFDRDIVGAVAQATAAQVRASGIPWNFAPVLDVGRQPLWPRLYETLGEDTYLVTELGRAYVQAHKATAAVCLKHYAGYSAPYTGRDRTPARLSRRELHDIYLPPFAAAIAAGAQSIMVNSGSVDAVPGHANAYLLTQVLRKDLKFEGLVVSDFKDIERLHTRDGLADSPKEAVRLAIMAGLDMSMVPGNYDFSRYLIELVHEHKVPMRRIDESVGRILRLKKSLGLMAHEHQVGAKSFDARAPLDRPEDAELAVRAAQETMTLLQNHNDTLPLKQGARVLLAGPQADSAQALLGGWSDTWQGDEVGRSPVGVDTILSAMRKEVKDAAQVVHAKSIEEAVDKAPHVDVIVLCLGEAPYAETPGNIGDLRLDPEQVALAQALEATGKPVVLVLVEGRPRVLGPIADKAAAVLMAYLPGVGGGQAIASTLYGRHNPSARLPITYPRAPNVLMNYDYLLPEVHDGMAYDPQWRFGEGLSYTKFAYSNLHVAPAKPTRTTPIEIDVTVRNIGTRAGKETAILYLTDRFASIMRPNREVRGFSKVDLQPGAEATVHFVLSPNELGFHDANGAFVLEPGEFTVAVGGQSAPFSLAR